MKKFSINCDFGGQMAPFTIYIGQPEQSHHPLHFQADWLTKQRGGTIPAEVMDAIAKLKDLADKNNVSLEELCVYALGSAQEEDDTNKTEEGEAEQDTGQDQEEADNEENDNIEELLEDVEEFSEKTEDSSEDTEESPEDTETSSEDTKDSENQTAEEEPLERDPEKENKDNSSK